MSLSAISSCFTKYFLLEQNLSDSKKYHSTVSKELNEELPFYERHRRLISFIIPLVIVHIIWWTYMGVENAFDLFVGSVGSMNNPRWMVSLTMVFGSIVAGATSEGGAAVAFPVLTLAMGILPSIARDFSFLIQSVGMTAASFSILYMGVRLEYKSLIYSTIGGIAGVIFGLEKIAPTLTPPYSKMYFVVIWFSFAMALFWLNYFHDSRKVYDSIQHWERGDIFRWKIADILNGNFRPVNDANSSESQIELTSIDDIEGREKQSNESTQEIGNVNDDENNNEKEISRGKSAVTQVMNYTIGVNAYAFILIVFGFIGGIFTSISGSGLDICSFSLLTLLFRVSERIATPTSVVLMAINTVIAYSYRAGIMRTVDPEVYNLWLVCIPIVVIGAPMGAIASSHFHRHILAGLIYITDTVQLVGALYVVQPWVRRPDVNPDPIHLCASSAAILVAGIIGFSTIAFIGHSWLDDGTSLQQQSNKHHPSKQIPESSKKVDQEVSVIREEGSNSV